MTKNEFEQFLSESFKEGVYFRELRLSEKEVSCLKAFYPKARVKRTSEVNDALSKSWYEINLLPVKQRPEKYESLMQENIRLKNELETLKKVNK
ncbi:hypothetical protein [Halobacillus litoralis]|uniref:hypothetical protein n=1 Tax=Halobacillus litoralis TaxID=45668 RepID=UPI001CFE3434|nr:hypothetical protein [Halobacillus litoralis]